MNTLNNYLKTIDSEIDIYKLPQQAQLELITFYQFLVFKYLGEQKTKEQKRDILESIFKEAKGKLPDNFKFNRDEIHER